MNKWVKFSMAGLALSASQVSFEVPKEVEREVLHRAEELAIDATDFFGGSKLKDRMVIVSTQQQIEMIQIMMG